MCDFETLTTSPTRVWAWASYSIFTGEEEVGTTIEEWVQYVSTATSRIYFHNLKFDGNFIVYWLLTNGFVHREKGKLGKREFSTIIADTGQWYEVSIKFENGIRVDIIDSLKLIPIPVSKIPKAFGLDINKLSINYSEDRDINHILTDDEREYVLNDVRIVGMALRIMLDRGMNKITTSSNAINDIKDRVGDKHKYYYPSLELSVDADCRQAYKGGWTYVNPKYQDMMVGGGVVYDVNSMYPYNMRNQLLPVGVPIYYTGQYIQDDEYPLYIQCLECELELKENKYPSIQVKKGSIYSRDEYIVNTVGPTLLTLTSVDLSLMFENYNVFNIRYISGYKFRGKQGIHAEYIDYWYNEKNQAKINNNNAYSYIAKIYLNGAYGKYGTNPIKQRKIPYYDPVADIVRYKLGEKEVTPGGYVPLAAFITAYSRDMIIRAANSCGDRFLYADTDSIHILGEDPPNIDIDNERLGAFKIESKFNRAKYLRSKCYIEEGDKTLKKCAGLPESCKSKLDFDTLKIGKEFPGKLLPKVVPGGVILVETTFKIKK